MPKYTELTETVSGDNEKIEDNDPISWEDASADCIRQLYGTAEQKTQMFYTARLRVLARWAAESDLPLAAFRIRHLREFLAQRASLVSGRTVRHDAVAARVFFRYCHQEGYIPSNPLLGYEIPKAARAYVKCPSDDEVRRLLAGMQDRWKPALNPSVRFIAPKLRTFLGRRNYAIIAGLVETACRIGEMLALTLADFDPAQKQITVRRAKGDKPRILPVSEAFVGAVEAWLRVRPRCASETLFITEYGDPLVPDSFSHQFKDYLAFAGLSGFTLHGLRHYALTQIARTDVQAAMHIAGHSSLVVTQGYLHAGAEHVRAAHAKAAPLTRLLSTKETLGVIVSKKAQAQKKRRLI